MQITFFIKYFSKGDDRSIKIKKNVISMLFLKGGSILVGLMLVPLTIDYVDSERYGIWLTLSSMVAWIHFFDIGINNGLRNKLGQAFANEDLILAKKYVSTTYALMSLIFLPVMIVLLIVSQYISWNEVLKIASNNENILLAVNILVVYFCINFILSTVNVVMLADQRPADASLRQLIQQLVSLLVVYLMTICTKGSLLNLCIGMCISPLIVLFAFNITLFNRRYRIIAPSFKQ